MKRIKYACLEQTLHFMLKEDGLIDHESAVRAVADEVEHYKNQLERGRVKYKLEEEIKQPDGSVIIKIRKQYNGHACGDYLD